PWRKPSIRRSSKTRAPRPAWERMPAAEENVLFRVILPGTRDFRMSTADKPMSSHASPTEITPAPPETAAAPVSAPTAVTERPGPAPDGEAIKLPPQQPRAAAPGGVSTVVRVLDVFLVGLVLALAVFLAGRPERDPRILRHLGTGQALVDGRYNPFAGEGND